MLSALQSRLLAVAVLAYLWLRLVLNLRVVWTVDEQYAYGWAVPFLCALLFWRRWKGQKTEDGGEKLEGRRQSPVPSAAPLSPLTANLRPLIPEARSPLNPLDPVQSSEFRVQSSEFKVPSLRSPAPLPTCSPAHLLIFFTLLLAFLFTRLVEEANPDWRLVGWALALEVTALSLLAVNIWRGAGAVRQLAFPILFFLVAVPWPTVVEQPLIQMLTRGIVAATVEFLNVAGLPALAHGNVIETAGGWVDIDEACSGIRSLQTALMLALFFGEWNRLNGRRRVLLLGLAFVLACVFNLSRTVVLSLVAAKQGSAAVARWHDPAGVTILVGCFTGVWLAAAWLARRAGSKERGAGSREGRGWEATPHPRSLSPVEAEREVRPTVEAETKEPKSGVSSLLRAGEKVSEGRMRCGPEEQAISVFRLSSISVFLLLLSGELAIHLWYASAPRVATVAWHAEFPRTDRTFQSIALPASVRQILRFNEGESGSWRNADGARWQMIYLRWEPGRVAATLARNHTPEVCLPAAGKNLRAMSEVLPVQADGLALSFRAFATEQNGRPLFVFYSLWEDGVREQRLTTQSLTRSERWSAVRERRRNPGQRVLEIAISGVSDLAEAETSLRAELPRLIKTTNP